jgi:Brp/Blh family beta-carotene 15,15'-monooxygenase
MVLSATRPEPHPIGTARRVPLGRGDAVPVAFWVAASLLTLAVVARQPLDGAAATLGATIVFLAGGLPHGAYDIALLARTRTLGQRGMAVALGGYVLAAVAMVALWHLAPAAALIVFLVAAAVHFGADWTMLDEPLLKIAAGSAILAAPAIGNTGEVTRLFGLMSDPATGALVARVLVAAAPVALLVTAVGVVSAWRDDARGWAGATTVAILLLLIAPPVAAFALFFVFLHSPRHLAETRDLLRSMSTLSWLATGAALSTLAVGGWVALTTIAPMRLTPDLTAQAFQLLASVAVPHLLLSKWIEGRLDTQATKAHP